MKIAKKSLIFVMCFIISLSAIKLAPIAYNADSVTVISDNIRALPTDMGESLIADQLPIYMKYKQADSDYLYQTMFFDNINITNGVLDDSWHYTEVLFAEDNSDGTKTFYDDGSVYLNVIFNLKKTSDISGLCVLNHTNKYLVTGKYELYASRYRHELFTSDSLIASIDNTANYDYRQVVTCSGVNGVNFVGLKVISPCQTGSTVSAASCYTRLSEFCVYGKEAATGEAIPDVENSCAKTKVLQPTDDESIVNNLDLTQSFLYGKTIENGGISLNYTYYESGVSKTATAALQPNVEGKLTDGDVTADWRTSTFKFLSATDKYGVGYNDYRDNEKYYVDVLFDAGSAQELSLFYIQHHKSQPLRTMHYKVYAANSTTFTESNLIADCINYGGTQDHYLFVAEGQSVKARYYLIRVYNPCYDYSAPALYGDNIYTNAYLRLNEVAAFTVDDLSGKLKFAESNFKFFGNYQLGGIKNGTSVKNLMNSFDGIGELYVLDKNGNRKLPSEKIKGGDRVVVDTGLGDKDTADIVVLGDLNSSGTHTVSDIIIARNAALSGKVNETLLATGDFDCDGSLTVSDVVETVDVVAYDKEYTDSEDVIVKAVQKSGKQTADTRKILVDTDTVINDNIVGLGTNSFPAMLSAESQNKSGYNMVYNELTRERLSTMNLSVSRMWFQVDWMVTETCDYIDYSKLPERNPDYKNYIKGVYDFENQWMQAVYEYIEMLGEAGTDVEINFGWKTATRIQDWFCMPCDNPVVSAPKNLEAFAAAAASLIEELHRRGYDNVKAITFYNEPNHEGGDFESGYMGDGHDDCVYWSKLVAAVGAEFNKRGLYDKVQVWGPEIAASENEESKDFLQYQITNSSDHVDVWTGHLYYKYKSSDIICDYYYVYDQFMKLVEMTDRNMIITEMQGRVSNGVYKDWINWNDSTASYFIAACNTGIKGIFTWMTVGGYLPDPLYVDLYSDSTSAWLVPLSEERANTVNRVFYEESLISNYIPKGSQVLYNTWTGDDIRASAYRLPDGNITLLVENNGYFSGAALQPGEGTEKNIEINVSDGVTREFRRISYIAETQVIDANATVNSPDKTITATNGVISDSLGSNYSVHIYTTAPAIKQVEIKDAGITRHVKAGNVIKINAQMVDCADDDTLIYSITESTTANVGTISANGAYTASADAKAGDMVAVRASLKSDPSVYATVIIYID